VLVSEGLGANDTGVRRHDVRRRRRGLGLGLGSVVVSAAPGFSRRETMWRTTAPGFRRFVLTRIVAVRR